MAEITAGLTDKQERELSFIKRRLKKLAVWRGNDAEMFFVKRLEEDIKSSSLPDRLVNWLRAELCFSLRLFYRRRLWRLKYRRQKAKGQQTKIRLENEYWKTIFLLRGMVSVKRINMYNDVLLNRA